MVELVALNDRVTGSIPVRCTMKKVNLTFLPINVNQNRVIIDNWDKYSAHEHIVKGTNLYNCIVNLKEGEEGEYDASGSNSWNCIIKVRLNKIIE